MGKKQLDFLKLKLGEIRGINNDIVNFSEQKKDSERKLRASKKKLQDEFGNFDSDDIIGMNAIEFSLNKMKKVELQNLLDSHGMDSKGNKPILIRRLVESSILSEKFSNDVKQLEKNLKDTKKEAGLSVRKAEVKDFKINNNQETSLIEVIIIVLSIITAIGAIGYGVELDDRELNEYYNENPFDCDNGETIHGSLVLNGEDDCSNGHDEKDPFWSLSDAQNYQLDEPSGFNICFLPIFVIGIGWFFWFLASNSRETKYRVELRSLEKKLKEGETKVSIVNSEYIYAKKLNELLSKNESQRKKLSELIENLEIDVASLKDKLSKLNKKRTELYAEISHLIPYSNLIK